MQGTCPRCRCATGIFCPKCGSYANLAGRDELTREPTYNCSDRDCDLSVIVFGRLDGGMIVKAHPMGTCPPSLRLIQNPPRTRRADRRTDRAA
jgi:hypothetical protein